MTKATKSAQHQQCTIENIFLPEETSDQEETGSDQEQEIEQEFTLSPPQAFPSMFMPYIEGPKWTGLLMIFFTIGSLNRS